MTNPTCPICCDTLHNDPENPAGLDEHGKTWPAMACLEHGLIGRRDDDALIPVQPFPPAF
jgi:hypothetical protein